MKKWFNPTKKDIEKISPFRKIEAFFIIIFALIYYFFGKIIIWYILIILLSAFLVFDLVNYYSRRKDTNTKLFYKLYPKKKLEKRNILTDGTIFFISTALMVLFLEKNVVVLSLIIFCFCDQAERIFGILMPSKKLYWSKSKNWAGTILGFIIAFLAGFISIKILNLSFPIWFLLPTSIVAALAGTMKNNYNNIIQNDNILMPWLSALTLSLFTKLSL